MRSGTSMKRKSHDSSRVNQPGCSQFMKRGMRREMTEARGSAVTADIQQLADLFHQTAEDHHLAFQATDGVDPDWSIWYADHLLTQEMEKRLDAKLLKSDLIYLLVLVDKEQQREAPGSRWERYYADFFLRRYRK
jgi:hypothetical protein